MLPHSHKLLYQQVFQVGFEAYLRKQGITLSDQQQKEVLQEMFEDDTMSMSQEMWDIKQIVYSQ